MESFNKFMAGFFAGVADVAKAVAAVGGALLTCRKLLKK